MREIHWIGLFEMKELVNRDGEWKKRDLGVGEDKETLM